MSGLSWQAGPMPTVIQLSDTHFSTPGHRSHGGFGYDTDRAFERVLVDAGRNGAMSSADLVVVTGDIVDRGRLDEYAVAAEALTRLPVPVNLLPGNHDFDLPLRVSMPRPGVGMDRTQRLDSWLFLYADSNHGGEVFDGPDRLSADGALGVAEATRLGEMIEASDADHVFVWMHHPPGVPGINRSVTLDAEVGALLDSHPTIRGIAAGHIHSDAVLEVGGRPVFVCPALTINFDFSQWTTLPPGYRVYRFADDGSIESHCHLLEDAEWPRYRLPEPAVRFFRAELDFDEMLGEIGRLDPAELEQVDAP